MRWYQFLAIHRGYKEIHYLMGESKAPDIITSSGHRRYFRERAWRKYHLRVELDGNMIGLVNWNWFMSDVLNQKDHICKILWNVRVGVSSPLKLYIVARGKWPPSLGMREYENKVGRMGFNFWYLENFSKRFPNRDWKLKGRFIRMFAIRTVFFSNIERLPRTNIDFLY